MLPGGSQVCLPPRTSSAPCPPGHRRTGSNPNARGLIPNASVGFGNNFPAVAVDGAGNVYTTCIADSQLLIGAMAQSAKG